MNHSKTTIWILGVLLLFACKNNSEETEKSVPIEVVNTEQEVKTEQIAVKYLSPSRLKTYLEKAKVVELETNYAAPFDRLLFDKVIAYDFERERANQRSVVDKYSKQLISTIVKQQELNPEQTANFIEFVTDDASYGGMPMSCFNPRMAVVFYHLGKIEFVVDICMECNNLVSIPQMPVIEKRLSIYNSGIGNHTHGFSKKGQENIIKWSKELGLDYGLLTLEALEALEGTKDVDE